MLRRNNLHVVRTDVLLWALGGFALDAPMSVPTCQFYARPEVVRAFAAIAQKPRAAHGEVLAFAKRLGLSRPHVSVHISRIRTGHHLPASWRPILAASNN